MDHRVDPMASRRRFLQYLAGSPFVGLAGLALAAPGKPAKPASTAAARALAAAKAPPGDVITSVDQALSVLDFEAVAQRNLPPAHFGYIVTGVEGDATVRANRDAFLRYQIRSRRLIDVSSIDASVEVLGLKLPSPIILAPAGSQRAFNDDGEIATAKAAAKGKHPFVLSTVGTTSIEDVSAALGTPAWYQLYAPENWNQTMAMIKRAEKVGSPVLVYTVDGVAGAKRDTLERAKRRDTRLCAGCHDTGPGGSTRRKPMFDGLDKIGPAGPGARPGSWDYVKRLQDATSMKVVLKGIVSREDAELAVQHGVAGIIVSNHGGRVEETLRGSLDSLPEVVEAVGGRIPVLVDGGFRRGSDVFKALALGANAVLVARPYLFGLAAFGQPGVEAVLDILRRETQMVMAQAGTTSIARIKRSSLVDRTAPGGA